jgi:hypothetical protein
LPPNLVHKISNRFGKAGLPLLLLFAGLLAALGRRGYILKGDTESYINNAPIVAPLYPLYLDLHAWIFGGAYLQAAALSQLVLGFGAALYLADSLRKQLSLPNYVTILSTLILIVPYFCAMGFGNSILSESLAYPLLLITMKHLLGGLLERKTSQLTAAFLWSVPLVLTRRQFVVLYPLFGLSVIYVYLLGPRFTRKAALVVTLIAVLAGTQLLERSCQYLRDGRFRPVPFSGFHLVTAALFVSQAGDGVYLADATERAVFDTTYARLKDKGLLFGLAPAGLEGLELLPVERYYAGYNSICWGTLLPVLQELNIQDWYRIEPLTRSLAWSLARHNVGDYLKLLRMNVVRDRLSLAAAVISLLNLGSLVTIALAEPVRARYITPTESLQICIYVIVSIEAWRASRPPHYL